MFFSFIISFHAHAAGQYIPCSSPARADVTVTGYGVTGTSCGDWASKVGITNGYSAVDTTTGCNIIHNGVDQGPANATRSTVLSCGAGTTLVNGGCVRDAFLALPPSEVAAILNSGSPYDTQPQADYACAAGLKASGRSPAAISAAVKAAAVCATTPPFDAQKCNAASNAAIAAVEAGKSAADAAAAAAAAAAASGGGGGGSATGATDPNSTNNASSPPPTSTMPDKIAASGIFYTPGTLTGGKTLGDVLTNARANFSNVPIISAIRNFLKIDGINGTCPSMQATINMLGTTMTLNFDSVFCSSFMDTFLNVCGVLLLIGAAFFAFRVAFL